MAPNMSVLLFIKFVIAIVWGNIYNIAITIHTITIKWDGKAVNKGGENRKYNIWKKIKKESYVGENKKRERKWRKENYNNYPNKKLFLWSHT